MTVLIKNMGHIPSDKGKSLGVSRKGLFKFLIYFTNFHKIKLNEGKYININLDMKSFEMDLKVKMADCQVIEKPQMEDGLSEDTMGAEYGDQSGMPLLEDDDRNFDVIIQPC